MKHIKASGKGRLTAEMLQYDGRMLLTLPNAIYKHLTKILTSWLTRKFDGHQLKKHDGFGKGFTY